MIRRMHEETIRGEMTARDGVIKICDKTVALPLTIVSSLSYRPGIPLRFFKNGIATNASVLSQNWIIRVISSAQPLLRARAVAESEIQLASNILR